MDAFLELFSLESESQLVEYHPSRTATFGSLLYPSLTQNIVALRNRPGEHCRKWLKQ